LWLVVVLVELMPLVEVERVVLELALHCPYLLAQNIP
jgi:hypothetical protein